MYALQKLSHPLHLYLQISNTEGELYSLPLRSPHFKWIQDFSTYDKIFTITPGKNGCLYVIMPIKGLVFSLDASSGKILWQRNIGPLSTAEYAPVVDSNGKCVHNFEDSGIYHIRKFVIMIVLLYCLVLFYADPCCYNFDLLFFSRILQFFIRNSHFN